MGDSAILKDYNAAKKAYTKQNTLMNRAKLQAAREKVREQLQSQREKLTAEERASMRHSFAATGLMSMERTTDTQKRLHSIEIELEKLK